MFQPVCVLLFVVFIYAAFYYMFWHKPKPKKYEPHDAHDHFVEALNKMREENKTNNLTS